MLKLLVDGVNQTKTRLDIAEPIAFAQMNSKFCYDRKHQPIALAIGDYALFQLYKSYNILF